MQTPANKINAVISIGYLVCLHCLPGLHVNPPPCRGIKRGGVVLFYYFFLKRNTFWKRGGFTRNPCKPLQTAAFFPVISPTYPCLPMQTPAHSLCLPLQTPANPGTLRPPRKPRPSRQTP